MLISEVKADLALLQQRGSCEYNDKYWRTPAASFWRNTLGSMLEKGFKRNMLCCQWSTISFNCRDQTAKPGQVWSCLHWFSQKAWFSQRVPWEDVIFAFLSVLRHQTCWNQLESQTMLIVIFPSDVCELSIIITIAVNNNPSICCEYSC